MATRVRGAAAARSYPAGICLAVIISGFCHYAPRRNGYLGVGDDDLWTALTEIGIELLYTGPVNRSGGIKNREYTPTIDAGFDPISFDIDPELGSAKEYRRMVQVAREHHGIIAGDLVPLHTGKGADFLLALRGYKNYPGIYTM